MARNTLLLGTAIALLLVASSQVVQAQNSSLYSQRPALSNRAERIPSLPPQRATGAASMMADAQSGMTQSGMTLKDASWTYVAVPPPREIQKMISSAYVLTCYRE